jgi:outer membrane protein OmpA-like peptidoglycan-associated protein
MKRHAFALAISIAFASSVAGAEKYTETTRLPPGTTGKVLQLKGSVLEIRGLASGVSGKSEALASALKDLGAYRAGTKVHIALSSDVLFDFDRDVLRPEAGAALDKVLLIIQSYPGSTIAIEGHSDSVGDDAYNQKLSERRARSVQTWLAAHNLANAMTTRGWGESKPVVPNTDANGADNPANRQKNRRVEIIVNTQ